VLINILLFENTIFPQILDLVVLFEEGGEQSPESTFPQSDAEPAGLGMQLIQALEGKNTIISSSPELNFLFSLATESEYDLDAKQTIARATDQKRRQRLEQDLIEIQLKRKNWADKFDSLLIGWDIYLTPNNNFTVLIPSNKADNLKAFNKNNLKKINWKKWRDLVPIFKDKTEFKINIDDFNSLLIDSTEMPKNIYASGHGQAEAGMEANEGSNGHSALVGQLSYGQYQKMLNKFNKIGCNFLYLVTCFGGGWNLMKAHKYQEKQIEDNQEIFSREQLKFPIVIGALTDATVYATSGVNLRAFFDSLNAFLSSKATQQTGDWVITDPLKTILKNISGDTLANTPLILFPGLTKFFQAVDVDNKVKIITLNSLLKLELGKKNINIKDKNEAILIYPLVVPLKIIIESNNAFPEIVSMIPGKSYHFIESIEASNISFDKILNDLGFLKKSARKTSAITPRALFIHKLKCKNSPDSIVNQHADSKFIELENVFISIQYTAYGEPQAVAIVTLENDQYFKFFSTLKIINTVGTYAIDSKKISKVEAENEIKEGLKKMSPDPQALKDITGGTQANKVFWQKIAQSLK